MMNYHAKNSTESSTLKTTEQIMAFIKASQRDEGTSAGTDYFAKNSISADEKLPIEIVGEVGATALSLNLHADEADIGATTLNNKDGIKNFKAVAPVAHPATASSGDDDITLENKPLAAVANEPTDKAVAVSLHSSADEQKIKETCEVDDDAQQTGESEPTSEGGGLFDPDFYKVSIDFFDNGEVRNKTRYTAKLAIQQHQDHDPANNDILFANFYSRGRDFKNFIEGQGCWDDWYEKVYAIFKEKRSAALDFKVKPVIAILKERTYENGKASYEAIRHTACVLYQVHGDAPVLGVIYQLWGDEIRLDAEFQTKDASAPKYKGYYVDPERAHLATVKRAMGMKAKTRKDFGK